jgi:hypothetical protein
VADGEDLDTKSKSKSRAGSSGVGGAGGAGGAGSGTSSLSPVNTRNSVGRNSGVLSCFGCFTSRHE